MPTENSLPTTMSGLTSYNGVKWIHDYQEACVDKIDRFIRGDNALTSTGYGTMMDRFLSSGNQSGTSSVSGTVPSYNRGISNDSTKPPSATSSSDEPPNTSEKD